MKRMILQRPDPGDENDFVFSLNDKTGLARLHWDGDDEFSLNGDMYDVIEKKTADNQLIVRALADKRETALVRKYASLNGDNGPANKTVSLIRLVSSCYLSAPATMLFIPVVPGIVTGSLPSVTISPGTPDVLTPPPQG